MRPDSLLDMQQSARLDPDHGVAQRRAKVCSYLTLARGSGTRIADSLKRNIVDLMSHGLADDDTQCAGIIYRR